MTHDFLIFAAIVVVVASGTAASDSAVPAPPAGQTDLLEAWPVAGVMQWPDYKKITARQAPTTPTKGPPPPANTLPDPRQDHPDQRARQARLSQQAKRKATRIIRALRPDLAKLVGLATVDEPAEPNMIRLVHGSPTRPPYLLIEFEVENTTAHPTHVRLHAQATGDEPDLDLRRTWRTYAEKTLQTVFGRPPEGKLIEQKVPNATYLNWRPIWKDRPLPRPYWTTFGAVKSGQQWVVAWTNRSSPQQIRTALDSLDRYPSNHDHQHAAMVVVKSTAALLPQAIQASSVVWVVSNPHIAGQLDRSWMKVVYNDHARRKGHENHGPVVPLWQVSIRPHRNSDRNDVVGWVDPATGTLLCLAKVERPGVPGGGTP